MGMFGNQGDVFHEEGAQGQKQEKGPAKENETDAGLFFRTLLECKCLRHMKYVSAIAGLKEENNRKGLAQGQ